MKPNEVISISTMEEFYKIRDMLNLSDRQKEIFVMKYSRRLRHIDIAEELGISQDTVTTDLKCIREKLADLTRSAP